MADIYAALTGVRVEPDGRVTFALDVLELDTVTDFDSDHGIRWRRNGVGAVVADIFTHENGAGESDIEFRNQDDSGLATIRARRTAGRSLADVQAGAETRLILDDTGASDFQLAATAATDTELFNGLVALALQCMGPIGGVGYKINLAYITGAGAVSKSLGGAPSVTSVSTGVKLLDWPDTWAEWYDFAFVDGSQVLWGFDVSTATQTRVRAGFDPGPSVMVNQDFYIARIGRI